MIPPDDLFNPDDLVIEIYSPWPKGGQQVGVRSAIKITHVPTGLVAIADCGRSQHRNKAIALDMILGGLTSPHFIG